MSDLDIDLDRVASRRESNRIAQQKHRQKTKMHEADLKAQNEIVRAEKEAAELKLSRLRQSREDAEQCIRHMVATWEELRVALQSSDLYQVTHLCAKALFLDLPIPVVPERQIDLSSPVGPARRPISIAPVVPVPGPHMARDRQIGWPILVAPERQLDWPIPTTAVAPEMSWSIPAAPEQLFGYRKYGN
ncbi:hypothetical protein MY11210_009052 [Beauveria gryllotalpidicola]